MAKVIGKETPTTLCKGCGSILEYDYSEVKLETTTEDIGFLFCITSKTITCPCCGKKIEV